MKKTLSLLLCALMLFGAAFADDYFTANDYEPCSIKEPTVLEDAEAFTIYATADKNVTIESLGDMERVAEDGEVFNTRIKLNGSGKIEQRSIHFITEDIAVLTVYTNSSSKTDARILVIVDVSDGTIIDELEAPADDGEAGIAETIIPWAGEFAIYSKGSGINIYAMVIEY